MQLTPEQQQQVQKARAAGEKRALLRFAAGRKDQWQAAVGQELDGKEANIAHLHKMRPAAEQPGFLGDIRRAITLSRRPVDELAGEIGVEPRRLSDFRAGDAELPSAALDRLLDALGLRLMQEIPR